MIRPAPVRRRTVTPRQVLWVASLGTALTFADTTMVSVAFPDIQRDFDETGFAAVSWVLTAYAIVFAAFVVAAGRIAELLGRKRLYEWGLLLFTLASGLCAAAPSLELLVAARALQALGAAVIVPAALALVLETFPEPVRGRGLALWSAAAALAAGLGLSLGGLLVEVYDWRLIFLIDLPIGVLALLASERLLVESRAPGRRVAPDLVGALLLAAAAAGLTLGIVQGDDWGWGSASVLASLGAGLALGAAFVERCTWHRAPLVHLSQLRDRRLAAANLATVVAAAGLYALLLCSVLFLTTLWGYSALETGLAITCAPLVAAAVARPARRLTGSIGPGPAIGLGGLIVAAGAGYLALAVEAEPDFVGRWMPGMAILGLGAGIAVPALGLATSPGIVDCGLPAAAGINMVGRRLGAVLGVAALVAIVGSTSIADLAGAFDDGWTFAAACFAVAALASLAIGRVEAPSEPAPERPGPSRRAPRPPAFAGRGDGRAQRPPEPRPKRTHGQFLREVPMFAGLPGNTLDWIAARAAAVRLHAGELLFREGDPADGVYVVVSGRLDVLREGESGPEVLRVLGPEAVVGELALVAHTERSASIRARRDSELLKLTREEFDALVAEDPGFTSELVRLMGVQLQRSRALEPPGPSADSVIALVPAHEGLPLEAIASGLVSELAASGDVVRLDRPAALPLEPAAEAELLERYEQQHDQVLLVAGGADDWLEFSLRHSDRIAVVAGERPVPAELANRPALEGCDLLFATEASGDASFLGEWLDALTVRASHLLQPGAGLAPSLAAAARRLAGRSVGLVLSGGGARAFAHIGVLDELLGAGMAIDRVGGCSMGAFVGAMFALGMDPDEIDARCYEEWVRRNPLNDYRIPRHSLIRGEKVQAMLSRNLPGTIEELPRDFFCVSGDLPTAELVVHRRGPLWMAVGASMSLPGLVTPALLAGRMLVDGGVLNNLPVEVMAAAEEGPMIAVDVTSRFEPPTAGEPDGAASGRRRRRAAPEQVRAPGFTETLIRALTLGSADTVEAAREHADLAITPSGDGVGMLDFHQLDHMREAGRLAAAEALAAGATRLLA